MKSIVFVALLVFSLSSTVAVAAAGRQRTPARPKTSSLYRQTQRKNTSLTSCSLIKTARRCVCTTICCKARTVIINSFFATCQGSCLPITRNLEKVQEALGDRLGKDARIISISVDPTVDTPGELKAFGKKFHARPGWYFLTGSKENVEFVLKKLGQFVENKQDHYNIIIIGNERTGLWKKAFGLAKSEELVKVVESVLNDKTPQD